VDHSPCTAGVSVDHSTYTAGVSVDHTPQSPHAPHTPLETSGDGKPLSIPSLPPPLSRTQAPCRIWHVTSLPAPSLPPRSADTATGGPGLLAGRMSGRGVRHCSSARRSAPLQSRHGTRGERMHAWLRKQICDMARHVWNLRPRGISTSHACPAALATGHATRHAATGAEIRTARRRANHPSPCACNGVRRTRLPFVRPAGIKKLHEPSKNLLLL
jgi:hypothetical protein